MEASLDAAQDGLQTTRRAIRAANLQQIQEEHKGKTQICVTNIDIKLQIS